MRRTDVRRSVRCGCERLEGRVLFAATQITSFGPSIPNFSNFAALSGHLLYTTRDQTSGDELFSSDGTAAGVVVKLD